MGISTVSFLLSDPKKSITGDDISAYTDGVDIPSSVRAIKVFGVGGKLVRQWELRFDAGSILNVDNETIHPDDIFDAIQSLSAENLMVTMIDNSESVWRDQSETVDIKIDNIALERNDKQSPGTVVFTVTEVV